MRYPNNDPEQGPAELHTFVDGKWLAHEPYDPQREEADTLAASIRWWDSFPTPSRDEYEQFVRLVMDHDAEGILRMLQTGRAGS